LLTLLVRYQAYVSGAILIYHATQLRIAGFSQEYCTKSFELAKKVVDVLEYCQRWDPVARKFFTSLSRHYDHLQQVDPSSPRSAGESVSADPQPDVYLFAACPEYMPLHGTSEELSRQLCNPYADEDTMHPQRREAIALDSHPGSIPEIQGTPQRGEGAKTLGGQTACGTAKPGSPNPESGYFVGSSEPSWWLTKRTCVSYSGKPMAGDEL
jgi:hypothetical protein